MENTVKRAAYISAGGFVAGLLVLLIDGRSERHVATAFSTIVMFIVLPFLLRREAGWWRPVAKGLAGVLLFGLTIGLRMSSLGTLWPARVMVAAVAGVVAAITLWSAIGSLAALPRLRGDDGGFS